MVETVASVKLPVDESLELKRNRLCGDENGKRLCIVTGIHGNELEGQYVCYELARRIEADKKHLKGIVDLYPAVNPLGINSVSREIPISDLDMNRLFPGASDGSMAEYLAAQVVDDILGADLCLDLHSSNVFLREVPQVRIHPENEEALLPMAKLLNMDYIWISAATTVTEASLVYSLNKGGIPALAVEMGTGLRISMEYGNQLVDGIFRLMKELEIWDGAVSPVRTPILSTEGRTTSLRASREGIFLPEATHWKTIQKGQPVGRIVSPLDGTEQEAVRAPFTGLIFTMREYPVVTDGSLIARIFGGVVR